MKKIRMIKSVYDNHRAETIDDYHNETSKQLTAFFFGDGHPFRERMRRKVFDNEIAIRRVRLIPVKMEEPPHAAGQEPIVYIHQLLLEVIMKDPALEGACLTRLCKWKCHQTNCTGLKKASIVMAMVSYR